MNTQQDNSIIEIKTAVREFMGNHRVCWAKLNTSRWESNFYGSTTLCRFTAAQLADLIAMYHENYGTQVEQEDGTIGQALEQSIYEIIYDMTLDKPAE